jgi:hypothetical protein
LMDCQQRNMQDHATLLGMVLKIGMKNETWNLKKLSKKWWWYESITASPSFKLYNSSLNQKASQASLLILQTELGYWPNTNFEIQIFMIKKARQVELLPNISRLSRTFKLKSMRRHFTDSFRAPSRRVHKP